MNDVRKPVHWTEDETLLAEFALGKITGTERADLQRHLDECAQCADTARRELLLAAGAKRLGREGLRADLSQRLGRRVRPAFPWGPVLSAAAVVVIAAGVAVYNRWIILRPEPAHEKDATSVAALPEPDQPSSGHAGKKAHPDLPPPSEAVRPAEESAVSPGGEKQKSGADESAPIAAEAPKSRRAKETGEQPVTEAVSVQGLRPETEQEEWWAVAVPPDHGILKTRSEPVVGLEMKAGKAPADATPPGDAIFLVRQEMPARPSGAAGAAVEKAPGFPVRITREPGRAVVTLFPPSPIDTAALQGASVRPSGPDSLILRVGETSYMLGRRPPPASPGER